MTIEDKIKAVKGFGKLKVGEWYNIANRADFKDLVAIIKWMSDSGVRIKLSDDTGQVMLYDDAYTMIPVEEGFTEEVPYKNGTMQTITHQANEFGKYKPSWRVYLGSELISIEI